MSTEDRDYGETEGNPPGSGINFWLAIIPLRTAIVLTLIQLSVLLIGAYYSTGIREDTLRSSRAFSAIQKRSREDGDRPVGMIITTGFPHVKT